MYIIECENNGKPWWIAEWGGDPGRTIVRENAQVFKTRKEAGAKRSKIIKENPLRVLKGRLKIVPSKKEV